MVVDLGCGPGTLTAVLTKRWPDAQVRGIDSSQEMVVAAQGHGIAARVGDIAEWTPSPGTDVVISNAALQWVPGHGQMLTSWARALSSGSWLAFQVPGNFGYPSHAIIRELAASTWKTALGGVVLRDEDAVLDAGGYADLLTATGAAVDAWETVYLQRLEGQDPVLDWVSGTALRPIRAVFDDGEWRAFRADLAPLLRAAYPTKDGITWFPFRRVFCVAQIR